MSDYNLDEIEQLLAQILDPTQPLPGEVGSPQSVVTHGILNSGGGSSAALDHPEEFMAAKTLPTELVIAGTEIGGDALLGQLNAEIEQLSHEADHIQAKDPTVPRVMAEAIASATNKSVPRETKMDAAAKAALLEAPVAPGGGGVFLDSEDRTEEVTRAKVPVFTSEDLAETLDIRNYACMVKLNTSRWHAKVKDRQASRDAAMVNNANERAFETSKRLLAGADEKLRAIHKVIDEARLEHYRMTLPWTTTGVEDMGRRTGGRLLPNSLFFDYTKAMAEYKVRMDQALDDFVPEYPSLVQKAVANLGKRFNPAEYPNSDSIRSHFSLSFEFEPVPVGTDFKGLPDAQLERLTQHLNDRTRIMAENAMAEVWSGLRDTVAKVYERLSSPDKSFHYTLIENVKDTVRLSRHLNVTNDQRVERICKLANMHLCKHDAKELREKHVLRGEVAAKAAAILEEMDK